MNYIVSYDLLENDNIERISNEILFISNGSAKLLGSTWIIKHKGKASDIRNHLGAYIGVNDKLIVFKLRREAAWTKSLNHECKEWLESYF